jgi:putative copper export protein
VDDLRLFLHVLAATVWVGGQLVLAALVPVLRRVSADAPRAAARQFNRVAWPAFGVLVLTGIWNVYESDAGQGLLTAKLAAVVVSGAAAYAHSRATSRAALAGFGALTAVAALVALYLGVALSED